MAEDDDKELWSLMTRDVAPIARAKPLDGDCEEAKQPAKPKQPKKRTALPVQPKIPIKTAAQEPGAGLDRKTAEKLRKGQLPIEARLDLHGMNQAQAHSALHDFIARTHGAGKRCVLVITGKGVGADGRRDPLSSGQGVLKRMVPEWLAEASIRPYILKTAAARPQHGGEGALYVLLRRQRRP